MVKFELFIFFKAFRAVVMSWLRKSGYVFGVGFSRNQYALFLDGTHPIFILSSRLCSMRFSFVVLSSERCSFPTFIAWRR